MARSELGIGTTVTVVLPATAGSVTPAAASQEPASGCSARACVDDEAAIREVAHRVLTSAGYQVETAATGTSAWPAREPGAGRRPDPDRCRHAGMTGAAFAARPACVRSAGAVHVGYEQGASADGGPNRARRSSASRSPAALLAR